MRMKLHQNTVNGAYEYHDIFMIDHATMSTKTGYTQQISPTTAQGVLIHRWTFENSDGINMRYFDANIPRLPEASGNILPQRYQFTSELGGYKYLENWFDPDCWEAVSEQPLDWGTNTYYFRTSTPSSAASNITKYVVPYLKGNPGSFESGNTYLDKKHMCSRILVTEEGNSFGVSKCSMFVGMTDFSGYNVLVGDSPRANAGWDVRIPYMFKYDGTVLNNNLMISDQNNGADPGRSINDVCCFVEYTAEVSGRSEKFYGIAIIRYSSLADDAVPRWVYVVGLGENYWTGSIVAGGAGSGTWGNPVQQEGGNGTFTAPSDSYGDRNGNTVYEISERATNANIGMFCSANPIGIYKIATGAYSNGASWIPGDWATLTKIYSILYSTDFFTAYQNSGFNPLSAVLSVHLLPREFTQSAWSSQKKLVISGYPVSDKIADKYSITAPTYPILHPTSNYHVGDIDIANYFGSFPDFAPYTTVYLHLPYIGKVQLSTNALMYGTISVDYVCDTMSGNLIAYIWCKDKNGVAQYVHTATGNCAYSIPLYTLNQDGSGVGKMITSSLVTFGGIAAALSAAVSGGTSLGVLGGALTAIGGAVGQSQAAMDIIQPNRATEISGTLGGNNSLISPKDCWLEIIRPEWVENKYYQHLHGIPSQFSNTIYEFSDSEGGNAPFDGFLQVEAIDLDTVDCTDSERSEIENLLMKGVFIRGEEI